MSTHTPGPWEVSGAKGYPELEDHIIAGADLVALVCRDNMDANARLIAAAPTLLEIVDDCIGLMEEDGLTGLPLYRKALDAFAKAKGETP